MHRTTPLMLLSILTLCATTAPVTAAMRNTAAYCLSEGIAAADYWRQEVQDAYDADPAKSDADFSDASISNDGFSHGGGSDNDTSSKRGLVYAKFGRDSNTPDKNYIVIAYFGQQCGVVSDSKLFCNLQEDNSGWSNFTDDDAQVPITDPSFRLDCRLCYDVHVDNTGTEGNATDSSNFQDNDLVGRVSALTSAISNAKQPSGGVFVIDATPRDWNSHTPSSDCQTVTYN